MRKALLTAFLLLAACETVRQGVAVLSHQPHEDASRAEAGRYRLDPQHASVHFGVRHLGFSTFIGRFDRIAGALDFMPQSPADSGLEIRIDAASINSNAADIDATLREELFESDRYPEIRFIAKGAELTGASRGIVHGALLMAGRSHPLDLAVTFNGAAKNPLTGVPTLGFSATATLDRSDWGLGDWYPAVAKAVEIRIEAEFVLDAQAK